MSSAIKQVRGQIRQIVKEILPEVLGSELQQENAKALRDSMNQQMAEITKNITEYLKSIEDRQKDFQSYVIRQFASSPPVKEDTKEVSTV